ncbi:MAG: lactonase family protein [Chthoniobacterales bacterium]
MNSSASARDQVFYLGTLTKEGGSQGIYKSSLHPETGKLDTPRLVAEAKNPSFLTLSPNGKYAYAALLTEKEISAYSVEADGSLTLLNTRPSGGATPCHITTDSQGRYVFVANYSDGTAACFSVQQDGSLGEETSSVAFDGSGPNVGRQKGSHAHGIYPDSKDRFVYVCDLGSDQVWSLAFDSSNGSLMPTTPASGHVPPGGGPRHLAFHPNGKFAYTNNEMGLSVTVFSIDPQTGTLMPLQTLSTLSDTNTLTDNVTTSALFIHPTGRWLYVSSRVSDQISVFSIAEDGQISLLENVPAEVKIPRGMGLDPTGNYLIVAGEKDDALCVFRIDSATGKLTFTGEKITAPAPVCVTFAPTD